MAREVLMRILQLGLVVGLGVGGLMLVGSGTLPALFTSDSRVVAVAQAVMPVLALYMVGCVPHPLARDMRGQP
jgi:Na+-driven multidrug efflux pump